MPWRCPKRVGFLFPHPCDRLTPIGCPDCNNGAVDDPYSSRTDRHGYADDDFDTYSSDQTSGGSAMGFTEADGESLTRPDKDFEDDQSAS